MPPKMGFEAPILDTIDLKWDHSFLWGLQRSKKRR